MDLRRGFQHEYGRSRGADGGGYGAPASSSGRAVPPTAVPSLSTGQGFYTVESLQGATMVPPPQPAPPPPRLLPPLEPYARDLPPPRRLHAADRGDFGPYERRYPPPPSAARKMMMAPPPDMPYPRRGEGLRGPGMLPHRPPPPPPFMGDPRMPGFFPGRNEPPVRRAWGPGEFERRPFDYSRDRNRPFQRSKAKRQVQKTAKPVSQAKSPSKGAAADKKSSADKQNPVEGGPGWCAVCKIDCLTADSLNKHIAGKRHKKLVESQILVEKSNDKAQELKEEDGAMATASQEAARKTVNIKENEGGEAIEVKEGKLDHTSVENMDVDASQGDIKSETTEPKSVAGKKRALKDAVTPRKSRKSAASSDAPNATTAAAVKGAEDATNADEVPETHDPANAEEIALDRHIKGADDASTLKTSAVSLQLKGDGNEAPISETNPLEEMSKEGGDGLIEVRGVTDLESGRTGQSAEVQ